MNSYFFFLFFPSFFSIFLISHFPFPLPFPFPFPFPFPLLPSYFLFWVTFSISLEGMKGGVNMTVIENVLSGCDPTPSLSPSPSPSPLPSSSPPPPWQAMKVDQPVPRYKKTAYKANPASRRPQSQTHAAAAAYHRSTATTKPRRVLRHHHCHHGYSDGGRRGHLPHGCARLPAARGGRRRRRRRRRADVAGAHDRRGAVGRGRGRGRGQWGSGRLHRHARRVPRGRLGRGDVCPICNSPFLDDPYPLVVRLPCHPDHIFDLECIAPWLKLKSTCPLDRKELVKKRPVQSPAPAPSTGDDDDGEEEWDDQYG